MTKKIFSICMLNTLVLLFSSQSKAQTEPPRVTAVEPSSTVTTPGAKVTVVGADFPPDAIVYFGGLQARQITFVNGSALQAITPYLRPGNYKIDIKSGETIIHSDVGFIALPAQVDSKLDQAEDLVAKKQINTAISLFTNIATTNTDYDVRAYAHYRAGQLYLVQGDYWAAGGEAGLIFDEKASMGVQSCWQYRVLSNEITYSVSQSNDHDTDLGVADWAVKWDITENPEPRFWRALMNARFGKMDQAKADLKFALAAEPNNPTYRALAAYMAVLAGDKAQLDAFRGQQVADARALALLGQAAYISGDQNGAQAWWSAEGKVGVWQAKLNCGAGAKHVNYDQTRIGTALLAECAAVAPDSLAKQARKLLAGLSNR